MDDAHDVVAAAGLLAAETVLPSNNQNSENMFVTKENN